MGERRRGEQKRDEEEEERSGALEIETESKTEERRRKRRKRERERGRTEGASFEKSLMESLDLAWRYARARSGCTVINDRSDGVRP